MMPHATCPGCLKPIALCTCKRLGYGVPFPPPTETDVAMCRAAFALGEELGAKLIDELAPESYCRA